MSRYDASAFTALFEGVYIASVEISGKVNYSSDPPSVLRTIEAPRSMPPNFYLLEIVHPAMFEVLKQEYGNRKSELLKIVRLNENEVGLWVIAENKHLMCYRAPNDKWEAILRTLPSDP